MFERQRSGSVVCRSCGQLVGVSDERCYNCGSRYPALWGWAPVLRRFGGDDLGFAQLTIGLCAVLYLASLLVSSLFTAGWSPMRGGFLSILGASNESLFLLGSSGIEPVWRFGRWWTVLSAGWLHGSVIHIGFNMYWVWILARPVARLYGPGRMIIVYVGSSVVGFLAGSLGPVALDLLLPGFLVRGITVVMGVPFYTVGASAALMGLLGALVHYGRRGGSTEVGRWAWGYVVLFLVFGLVIPRVDNWAHAGGFLGGWLLARLLDPMKPERLDHLATALGLLAVSLLAVLASVITGWGILAR